jgi:hypothetical protein
MKVSDFVRSVVKDRVCIDYQEWNDNWNEK